MKRLHVRKLQQKLIARLEKKTQRKATEYGECLFLCPTSFQKLAYFRFSSASFFFPCSLSLVSSTSLNETSSTCLVAEKKFHCIPLAGRHVFFPSFKNKIRCAYLTSSPESPLFSKRRLKTEKTLGTKLCAYSVKESYSRVSS